MYNVHVGIRVTHDGITFSGQARFQSFDGKMNMWVTSFSMS